MRRIGLLAAIAAAFVLCYAAVIRALVESWATSYTYSYGFVVLLISLYLLRTQSTWLRKATTEPDYLGGVPVTLAGLGMLIAGRLGSLVSLQEGSLIVPVAGFLLLFAGRRVFARVWFPLAYLLVAFPIWDSVIARVQPPSQVLSAAVASGLLQVLEMPIVREGTRLVLPNVVVEVMRECSGVNQVVAVVAMA